MNSFLIWLRTLVALSLVYLPLSTIAAPANGDVLVFGGTGQLGSEIVKSLVGGGHSVTVFARPSSDRSRLNGLDISYVLGDVLEEADVEAAFKAAQFRVVIDALARRSAAVSFYAVSGRYLAKWASATDVKQAILHGSVGAGDSMATYPVSRRAGMVATMKAKTDAENALIDSGVNYTIIRNARLSRHGTPGTGQARLYENQMTFGAVTRADLGRLTLECVDNPDCLNKIFHAADESLPGWRVGQTAD
jgi:uncharacterized protein YbjT (DUF2867 family)